MNKYFLIGFILIGFIHSSFAQKKDNKSEEDGGLYLSFNYQPALFFYNNPFVSDSVSNSYKMKYNASYQLVLDYRINYFVEIGGGVALTTRGYINEEIETCSTCNDAVEENNFKVNYIDIPLSLKVYYYNSKVSAYARLGLNNSIILNAKNTQKLNKFSEVSTEFKSKDEFSPYQLGIQIGMGFNWNFSQLMALNFEAGYQYSPLKMRIDRDLKYHNVLLQLGLRIKLK